MNTLYKVYFTGFFVFSLVTTTLMVATVLTVMTINLNVTKVNGSASNEPYISNNASSGNEINRDLEVIRLIDSPATYSPQPANPRGWL